MLVHSHDLELNARNEIYKFVCHTSSTFTPHHKLMSFFSDVKSFGRKNQKGDKGCLCIAHLDVIALVAIK